MAWPKGVSRKKNFDTNIITPSSNTVLIERRIDPSQIRYDLNLCIRAFREGRFKGLWELSKVDNEGKRTIIIDATSRQSMINMINRQIMRMVIAS